jgi:hypothetical protein
MYYLDLVWKQSFTCASRLVEIISQDTGEIDSGAFIGLYHHIETKWQIILSPNTRLVPAK